MHEDTADPKPGKENPGLRWGDLQDVHAEGLKTDDHGELRHGEQETNTKIAIPITGRLRVVTSEENLNLLLFKALDSLSVLLVSFKQECRAYGTNQRNTCREKKGHLRAEFT